MNGGAKLIVTDKALSRVALFIACYFIFYDAISYYQDVTVLSVVIALFVFAAFLIRFAFRGVEVDLLGLVCIFFIANLVGLFFSDYDLKYKYAFYRLFPLVSALFVYWYCDKFSLGKLVVFSCVLNGGIGLYECLKGVDVLQSQEVLYYADYFGGVVRANGLFWYSLPYSSFLLYSFLLVQKISGPQTIPPTFPLVVLLSSFASFNKMNFVLLGLAVVCMVYSGFRRYFLNGLFNRIVFWFGLSLIGALVFWYSGFFYVAQEVLNVDSTANAGRFKFWSSGVQEFLSLPFIAKFIGVNLGVYEIYGNGFESQYIQFLAEYGFFGCLVFLIIAYRMLSGGSYLHLFILFLSFVTVRALDSYASAFIIYLLVFYSSAKYSVSKYADS